MHFSVFIVFAKLTHRRSS